MNSAYKLTKQLFTIDIYITVENQGQCIKIGLLLQGRKLYTETI